MRMALLATAFLVLASGAAEADGGRSVVLGGTVCADARDVIWATEDTKVWRWHHDDGVVSEIEVESLGQHVLKRWVLDCLARPNGVDLYFQEDYVVDGAKPREGFYNTGDVRTRTMLMAQGRQRVLLDQLIPENDIGEQIRFFSALGVGLRDDLTLERYSDGVKYKIKIPSASHLLGVWPASRDGRVDPPELVICYAPIHLEGEGCVAVDVGGSAMQQRDIPVEGSFINLMDEGWGSQFWPEAQYNCGLKGPASKGNEWPKRASFDCRKDPQGGTFGARYPMANGYVIWETQLPAIKNVCRQRSISEQQYIVDTRCFEIVGDALLAAVPGGLRYGFRGYEYPEASQWTVTLFVPKTNRPITAKLLPTND